MRSELEAAVGWLKTVGVRRPTELRSVRAGSVNRVLRTTGPDGTHYIKRIPAEARWRAERGARLATLARGRGIPAVEPLSAGTSGPCVDDGSGGLVVIFPSGAGGSVPRSRLRRRHATGLGAGLAEVVLALARAPLGPGIELTEPTVPTPAAAAARLEAVLQLANAGDRAVDRQAVIEIRHRLGWLEQLGGRPMNLDQALTPLHGDYQDSNLLFDDAGSVVGVLDWDQPLLCDPLMEVMRVLDFGLQLHPGRGRALLEGYAQRIPLELDPLRAAAALYGWRRGLDVWVFEEMYLRGNRRMGRFVRGERHLPFEQRWLQVEARLLGTPFTP